jgi:hypothetical protein
MLRNQRGYDEADGKEDPEDPAWDYEMEIVIELECDRDHGAGRLKRRSQNTIVK